MANENTYDQYQLLSCLSAVISNLHLRHKKSPENAGLFL
jgi:hypothetical protein